MIQYKLLSIFVLVAALSFSAVAQAGSVLDTLAPTAFSTELPPNAY